MIRHLTLPNQLTIFRLALVPVLGYTLTATWALHDQVSVVVYGAAAATDTLDGRIARKRHLESELGKFLDPLADKILVITVLAILLGANLVPFWVVIAIIAREFVITGVRFVAAGQGVVVGSTPWGKSKTVTQNMMLALLMLQPAYPVIKPAAFAFTILAVVLTLASGVDYLWRYRRFVI